MAILGKMNPLKVVKIVDFGVYLDGMSDGEILMPTRYVPEDCKVGDTLSVFIYKDSEDRLIATTLKPYAMVGEFACLEVESVSEVGAFLDWGLMKQLLVPFNEQYAKMFMLTLKASVSSLQPNWKNSLIIITLIWRMGRKWI